MEIHADHLHKAPSHGWKHYLFEFFMLFLAVFCGFLAENQREHLVEHRQEIQYMKSLREDLIKDINQVDNNLPLLRQMMSKLDSAANDFSDLKNGTLAFSTIKLFNEGLSFPDFIYNDRTIQQLKNAGNMRLTRNETVADSISNYDGLVRRGLVGQKMTNNIFLPKMAEQINHTVNMTLIKKLSASDLPRTEFDKLSQQVLLTNDKKELIRFANELINYKHSLMVLDIYIIRFKTKAKELLELVNKEYQLQNN